MSNNSDLVLQNIRVKRFEFEINESVQFQDGQKINISITPKTNINPSNIHEGVLELDVSLFNKEYQVTNDPFYLSIVVQGIFKDDGEGEEDLFSKYFPNMLSMVYSYIRTYISSITGMFGTQSINIPTINVFKLLESNPSNDTL